mmetsp:Transcript_1667/g.1818  ORF Transcript_1667/g.1818 Transcript_1667/m.1818 type:complete len:586 (-) Transcript_1667:2577-4334(-)
MGNNLSIANKRFEGGKLPFKHWNEDIWPSIEDLYDKFNLDQSGGYEIFKAYISIAEDNARNVTSQQCQEFFGGRITNYTKRVFFHIGTWDQQNDTFLEKSNESKDKLTFEDFTILIWNYCSYSALHLSRQLFEIYDVSMTNQLERPDLESMYRMMYDCDTHEEWCIAKFPLDIKGLIDKKSFIQHCSKQKHLIQPAINFQRRIRNKTGGVLYWGSFETSRRKLFAIQDHDCTTLEDALRSIVLLGDRTKTFKKAAAEKSLAIQKLKFRQEAEQREKEFQEALELERLEEEGIARDDDWKVQNSWNQYKRSLADFEGDFFSTDEVWLRNDVRSELFDMLDHAVEESRLYWVDKDEEDRTLTEGTVTDHEARLKVYLAKLEGTMHFKYELIKNVLEALVDDINEAKSKRGKSKYTQTSKELSICGALNVINNTNHTAKLRYGQKFLQEEELIAKKYGTKTHFDVAEKKAHEDLYVFHKNKVIFELTLHQENQAMIRKKEHRVAQYELVHTYGARLSRWEYVYDNYTERMVYINMDTLAVIHRNSGICENCDNVIPQADEICKKCESKRSTKNSKLYRPYGYQDICVD